VKEIKLPKKYLNRTVAIIFAIFVLLITFWLGFSFISMQSSNPYLKTGINVQDSELKSKVLSSTYDREGKYIKYRYDIVPIAISYESNSYVIEAYDNTFYNYFEDIEDAKFKYTLNKSEGEFDFTKLDWDQPISLYFLYRVDNDFRYFTEFSICTLKKVYADIFDINNEYSNGDCMVNRKAYKWEVELIDIEE